MNLKRQLVNVFKVKAIDILPFLKRGFIFFLDYKFGNGKSKYPIHINFDITYRCNLNCEFCFLKKSVLNKTEERKEISVNDIRKVLEETRKFKPSIFISGGEPFIRPDLVEIIKLIKSYKRRCGMNTNGTLITEEKAKEIAESGLDYIFISVHNDFKITENIKNLTKIKKRPRVFLNYVLCEENLEALDKLVDYTKETKADGIFLQYLMYWTRKDFEKNKIFCDKYYPNIEHSCLESKPFEEEFSIKLLDKLDRVRKKAKKEKVFVSFKPREHSKENVKKLYSDVFLFLNNCMYVWNVAMVFPDGEVYPCPTYKISMGNIKNKNFFEIWNCEKFIEFRKLLRKKGVFPGCNRCCRL